MFIFTSHLLKGKCFCVRSRDSIAARELLERRLGMPVDHFGATHNGRRWLWDVVEINSSITEIGL